MEVRKRGKEEEAARVICEWTVATAAVLWGADMGM